MKLSRFSCPSDSTTEVGVSQLLCDRRHPLPVHLRPATVFRREGLGWAGSSFRNLAALQNVPWLALDLQFHGTKVACTPADIWRTTGVGSHRGTPQEMGPPCIRTTCPCGRGKEHSPPGHVSNRLACGIPRGEASSLRTFSQARQQ